ncbi:TPA: hypothetical protein ABRA77_004914 [Escherichia coli]
MSAFSFNTTYQPTGDQQKDAIAQIGIMQNRAVQANLAYLSTPRFLTVICHFHAR